MNSRRRRIVFVPLLVALFGLALAAGLSIGRVPVARAATPVYVRTDGDDTNCNGTTDAPYPGSGGPGLDCAFATVDWGVYSVDDGGTSRRLHDPAIGPGPGEQPGVGCENPMYLHRRASS